MNKCTVQTNIISISSIKQKFLHGLSKLCKARSCKLNNFVIKRLNIERKEEKLCNYLDDQRRLVFISLNGLYESWTDCPFAQMYSALLILPLKKEWIYSPKKYKKELKLHFASIKNYS